MKGCRGDGVWDPAGEAPSGPSCEQGVGAKRTDRDTHRFEYR